MKKTSLFIAAAILTLSITSCNKAPGKGNINPENPVEVPGNTIGQTENITVQPNGKDGASEITAIAEGYKEILASTYSYMVNIHDAVGPDEGFEGIWEAAVYMEDALEKIGYVQKDLNGDGVPELLIGAFDKSENAYTSNEIYALYTLADEKPKLLLEGYSRSMYSLKDDNSLFYQGSDGAAYGIFGTYHLDGSGNVVCDSYYFTSPDENNPEIIEIYSNKSGIFYADVSEKLDISLDDFYLLEKEAAEGTATLSATAFAELDKEIIDIAMKVNPAPDTSLLLGEWIFIFGETDGDSFTAKEAGIESEISITGTDSELTAKYFSNTEFNKSSLEATLVLSDEPLYTGCGNNEWSVKFDITKGTYSNGNEFHATLTDENTLLLQHIFPFDGALGVSYQTYTRK